MTNEQAIYRRVLRRELQAPRTVPAVVVATVGVVALVGLMIVGIWWWVDPRFREGAQPWLAGVAGLGQEWAASMGIGVVLVVLALFLLLLAVVPGRRPRRGRATERAVLLVDDGVIADSIAETVARRTGVERSRVSVTVGRREVTVRITPTSGMPVSRSAAASAVEDTLSGVGFALTPRVIVAPEGVIA